MIWLLEDLLVENPAVARIIFLVLLGPRIQASYLDGGTVHRLISALDGVGIISFAILIWEVRQPYWPLSVNARAIPHSVFRLNHQIARIYRSFNTPISMSLLRLMLSLPISRVPYIGTTIYSKIGGIRRSFRTHFAYLRLPSIYDPIQSRQKSYPYHATSLQETAGSRD